MGRPQKPLPSPRTAAQFLGFEIRYLRERAGLSSTALADLCGCSRTTIYGVETGTDVPSEFMIRKLDAELGAEGLVVSRYEAVLNAKRVRKFAAEIPTGPIAPDASDDDESWFVDETIPDGTLMPPGHHFVKTWTIVNTGHALWQGRYLQRVGASSGVGLITTPIRVPVPATSPGERVVFEVPCAAHYVEGTSRAHFKMADEAGRLYFPNRYDVGLVVQITVVLGMSLRR
jgi:transcriptional regulator with XRE-family HTH domain